jgi:ABC-type thiamine transport system ATPase subunit
VLRKPGLCGSRREKLLAVVASHEEPDGIQIVLWGESLVSTEPNTREVFISHQRFL